MTADPGEEYPFPETPYVEPDILERIPRRTVHPDPLTRIMNELHALRREVAAARNQATIAGGSLSGDAEPFTIYDDTDTAVARIGRLDGAGGYGIEVLTATGWKNLRL